MPLFDGVSKKIVSKNISELMHGEPGKARKKGIATLAKRRGISARAARQKQAVAISLNKAGKSKKR